MLLKCPQPEKLLEFATIPDELSFRERTLFRSHALFCTPCKEQTKTLKTKWDNLLSPKMDLTSSLLRVYSRLQQDETLILKGWKLDRRPSHSTASLLWKHGWGFRTGVFASLFTVIGVSWFQMRTSGGPSKSAISVGTSSPLPYARFRFEDKNSVKVKYVEPQLLQSVEFETTGLK